MAKYVNIVFPFGICLFGLTLFLIVSNFTSAGIRKRYIYKSVFFAYIAWIILYLLVPSNFWLSIWYNMIGGEAGEIDVSEFFSGSFNFVPRIFQYVSGKATYGGWTYRMLLGNIIMFVPFGMLASSITKNVSYRKIMLTSVMFASAVEILQPIVGRSFDIDDIIMRTVGTLLGIAFYFTLERIYVRLKLIGVVLR